MGVWELLWRLSALVLFTAMTAGGVVVWLLAAEHPAVGRVVGWVPLLFFCGVTGITCLLVDGVRRLRTDVTEDGPARRREALPDTKISR